MADPRLDPCSKKAVMCRHIARLVLISCAALAVFGCGSHSGGNNDLRAGHAAVERGDYDEAIRLLTSAIGSGDLSVANHVEALKERGYAWDRKEDHDRAIADYNEAIVLDPRDAEAFWRRGNSWHGKGEYDRAIADYDEAIRLNPKEARVFANRGIEWAQKNDYDRAIADYDEAIRLNPQLAPVFAYRGMSWWTKGDYDRAIADYDEAIRLNPKEAGGFYNRGLSWSNKKEYDRAIADYSEAIRLAPKWWRPLLTRGLAEFYKGEFSASASDLARSEQLNADVRTALMLYLARSRSAGTDGKAELASNTNSVEGEKWPAAAVALYLGKAAPDTVTSQAADPHPEKDKAQRCEANFYLGEWHLLRGEKAQARTLLTQAMDDCPRTFNEYAGAVAELERVN